MIAVPSTSPCTRLCIPDSMYRPGLQMRGSEAPEAVCTAQFSFSLYKEDGRRASGSEVVSLAFDSEAEAARWASALQEALHALRSQARAALQPSCFLKQAMISCSAAVEASAGP